MSYVDPRKKRNNFLIPDYDRTGQYSDAGGYKTEAPPPPPPPGGGGGAPPPPQGGSDYVMPEYGVPAHDASGAATIYDNLVKSLNASSLKGQIGTDWLTQYKEQLINSIIPAAQRAYGNAGIQNAFQSYWKKAILMAYSAATGKPFYDKTGDGSMANLLFIPGYGGYGPSQIESDKAEYIV